MHSIRRHIPAALLGAVALGSQPVLAQGDYPAKPITMVVSTAGGTPTPLLVSCGEIGPALEADSRGG